MRIVQYIADLVLDVQAYAAASRYPLKGRSDFRPRDGIWLDVSKSSVTVQRFLTNNLDSNESVDICICKVHETWTSTWTWTHRTAPNGQASMDGKQVLYGSQASCHQITRQ